VVVADWQLVEVGRPHIYPCPWVQGLGSSYMWEDHLLTAISTENLMRLATVYLELVDRGETQPKSAAAQMLISVASV